MVVCPICGNSAPRRIEFDSLVMPTVSSNPALHVYDTYLCESCGVAHQQPQLDEAVLRHYYNDAYRHSQYTLQIDGRRLEPPVAIPQSGISFQRFQTFYDMVQGLVGHHPDLLPAAGDWIADFGAYQGMFLYAARKVWNCGTVACDYNKAGIAFAKSALGIDEAQMTQDIYTDKFDRKARFATMLHAFEHLREPLRFLRHLRQEILEPGGYLYLEVPNLYACPLSDPTHFFMYSPDGLRYVLARAGFETVALRVHGHPAHGATVWENTSMNISGLFRSVVRPVTVSPPRISYRALKRNQRMIARQIVLRHARATAHAILRLAYYVGLVLGVEAVSPRAARPLKVRLARWFSAPETPR